ncbi:hypothetical protein BGZ96_011255 [Linnemannia gamsii]|uniref:MIT domain-containing protein n=1 Tax=Linnemannia gamsii TaxID=64522 RepID=A0ABQ7KD68_9FUNG|nr:hypothetical protein BGZ96_011255 [Linnemannia gamsii]
MTPAPSTSRNRRSATLVNIPAPAGPPPPPPAGHPGTYTQNALGRSQTVSNHSPHSSFSSHSGPINNSYSTATSSYAPPRASFSSSSRASPVGAPPGRSGRDRDQDAWNDSAWRSIFDAALVKAQQAVQLDELQETTLAANLYAQAANDLGRVIPMCSSEKKKQSMLAIQAIYLDRVNQLRESAVAKNVGSHPGASPAHSVATSESNDGHNNYRYSVSNRNLGYVDDQYQPQQYQSQQYEPQVQQVQQQQRYQLSMQQQQQHPYQSPVLSPVLSPVQHYQTPQFQQMQHQEPPPQPQQQHSSGLRFFGKKRSKTQSSVLQPPEFAQQFQNQGQEYSTFSHSNNHNNFNNSDSNGYRRDDYAQPADNYTVPFIAPPPSPPPVAVPSIFMTQPPTSASTKKQQNGTSDEAPVAPQEQPVKSSKWRPFGKKKSKSLSNPETSTSFTPPPEMTPAVPVFTPHLEPQTVPVQYLQQQQPFNEQQFHGQNHFHEQPRFHEQQQEQQQEEVEQQEEQQEEEAVEYQDAVEYQEEFKNPAQGDWYVETATPEEDSYEYNEFENPAHYFDEDDEDVDPYYIADTKGRAKAFEGQDTGVADKDNDKTSNDAVVDTEPKSRRALTHTSSSYSQEQSFSPKFDFSQVQPTAGIQAQLASQEPRAEDHEDINDLASGSHQDVQGHHSKKTTESIAPSQVEDEDMAKSTLESVGKDAEIEPATTGDAVVEKQKTKRTWYGKKKKEKDPEREKEKQRQKEQDRLDAVARLMDDALFGASPKSKLEKEKLKEKPSSASLETPVSHHSNDHADRSHQSIESAVLVLPEVNFSESHISSQQRKDEASSAYKDEASSAYKDEAASAYKDEAATVDIVTADKDETATADKDESNIEEPYALPEASEPYALPEASEPYTHPEISEPANSESSITTKTTEQEVPPTVSDTPKRSKSRHFSIFKSKKNKDIETQAHISEGSPLSPTVTNDDSKSIHSQHTRKSSFSTDRKVEPPVVVRPKEKEAKKRDSDEYVPYEYQEEVEGPLMERVEVPENREVIGFVLPVEEVLDYTLEGNEEAALENWDSWVNQLESFEKVLSNKGLKKEKVKKAKKVKEEPHSPMSSTKANRSSIFGSLGRSDTVKSRNNTTLDLNSHALDNRPLSMSTTLLDDISARPSFQSSRSGESEAPSQFLVAPQTRKRWWKRKETNSFYRASHALSTADLEQDQHLSALLRSQSQVRSSDNLPLDHGMMSMPISFVEPAVPVQEVSKEAPAAMESVPTPDVKEQEKEKEVEKKVEEQKVEEKKVEGEKVEGEKVEEPPVPVENKKEEEEEEVEAEVAIAPMPKVKVKSSKPKLLPISTPLAQLLKIQNPEELWLYVQQAKTYATSRMNKGDKRSAAIALKRGQALEARWQEILLEMASSGEDTDGILEEDDEESSESGEESSSPTVIAPSPKKEKAKKTIVQAPVEDDEEEEVAAPTPASIHVSASIPVPAPVPTPAPVAVAKPVATVVYPVEEEDDDDEEVENYAAHRRRNTISRSSSTPDKYSKYKNANKTVAASATTNIASSQAPLATEDNADAKSVSSVKSGADTAGRLGSDATMEQMLESKNVDHVKYYIQRMKTDTVNKARNGSKFAALEGMKNVKVLQQHLADLLDPKSDEEEKEEEKDIETKSPSSAPSPSEERMIAVQPTIHEEEEEEDEEDEKETQAPVTKDANEETKAPTEKEE